MTYLGALFSHFLNMAVKDHIAIYTKTQDSIDETYKNLFSNALVLIINELKYEMPHIDRVYGTGFVERKFRIFFEALLKSGELLKLLERHSK